MRTIIKIFVLLILLFSFGLVYSQESYGGQPYLSSISIDKSGNSYRKKDGSAIEIEKLNNYTSKIYFKNDDKKIAEDLKKINIDERINVYGKSLIKEVNIVNLNNRIENNERYFHIFQIDSENAKSIQVYFKKFELKEGSELYIYDATGKNYLGAFTQKNNPIAKGEYEFGTQPLLGDKIFIELSYPKNGEVPNLVLGKIIHGFKNFYSNGGAFGESGACNVNAACKFTGNNNLSRNIKSVGVILLPASQGYYASCSGNLMNNGKQDGTPYFITAQHCIGFANTNNGNWNNEMITLFNYETKKCSDAGSTAPSDISKNSVLGADLLVESNTSFYDFAFLKLRTNKDVLSRYGVCYAGWDNSSNAYLANTYDLYGVHHPNGDVKKISLVKSLYPSNKDYSQNSIGNFLAVTWKDGIVEPGSSGSPLFNSFDRYIGNLSTGPGGNVFNCDNSLKYSDIYYTNYSRFSENYYMMRQWLDPNNSSIQSIGPYCPSSSISIGVSYTYVPPPPPSNSDYTELSMDLNRLYVHPSNTYGKKIYTKVSSETGDPVLVSENLIITRKTIDSDKIEGIYKILNCNELKSIKSDGVIKMRNSLNNNSTKIHGNIIGLDNDKIIVYLEEYNNSNVEIQSYKIVGDSLVYESYFNFPQSYIYNTKLFYKNNHLLIFKRDSGELYSKYLNNSNWEDGNTINFSKNPGYSLGVNIEMIGNLFFLSETCNGCTVNDGLNKLQVYSFQNNSPNFTLLKTYTNLYNSNGSIGLYNWKLLNISKDKLDLNKYYINYSQKIKSGCYNRVLELNLLNDTINHLNINISDCVLNSYFINNKFYTFSSIYSSTIGSNIIVRAFEKDNNDGVWKITNSRIIYGSTQFSVNDKYFLHQLKHIKDIDTPQFETNAPYNIFNLRELEYLFHSTTKIDDNNYVNTAAYNMLKNINQNYYLSDIRFGKNVYTNLRNGNVNSYVFDYEHRNLLSKGELSYDNKVIILSDYTEKFKKDSDITIAGTYAVVMKPGFSVSSADNIEFRAIAQKDISTANIPSCSFTFDDMINPQLGNFQQQMYLRQNLYNTPYYGKIIYKPTSAIENKLKGYRLYPNPTSSIVTIETEEEMSSLKIFTIDGKQIFYKDLIKDRKIELDLSHYPSGVYFINVYSKKGNILVNEKIIKK
ncbi:T9SS type A sorting domain-containing protein [Cloacibacterium sp.]|uniref:T9SS type A sorting domain-containing protein n=1 Tax=Cloacibacterium sp. TaxID=1913682 RepID=UPI0039E4989C